jgi:aspartate aminotransferase/aminotransferase
MIAKRLNNFDSGPLRRAFSLARQYPDAIDLSIGFPEDDTPEYIKSAGIAAIKNNHTRYSPSNGIPELRAAIAEKLRLDNNVEFTPEQVAVTPGVTTGILLTYLALLDPGDEILIPDPFFPPYFHLATMLGATPVLIDTYPNFQLTAELIEPNITPRTKALLINSPNNPSGAIYPENELRRIAELAKKHNLIILSDEIYEHFSYDVPHFSIASIYPQTVVLNGFSKAFAMTGWRIGYLAGFTEFIQAVNELSQYAVFSVSSIAERAALEALTESPGELTGKYRAKRDTCLNHLTPILNINGAQGAFYAFVPLPEGVTDLEFCDAAAKQGVIVLPSRAFSRRRDYARIAFATNQDDLEEGLRRLKRVVGIFA